MTKKILTTVLASVLTVSFLAGAVTGCGSRRTEADRGLGAAQVQQEAAGGVISVKVNPEVAVSYNENGMVTAVEGRNDDGKAVMADYTGYEGKECSLVISEIVAEINEAGYLVEEVEGQGRQITLEIEEGSVLPSENFLSGIVAKIQEYSGSQNLTTPVEVNGESSYGWSNYGDTDYGPDNDGVTDYNDTDYGPNNDGVTDYNDTDYGPNNDGVTDYDNDYTDYGTGSSGSTGQPQPSAPVQQPSAPSSGDSGYDDGDSGYDDGDSGYDDGDSDYDD